MTDGFAWSVGTCVGKYSGDYTYEGTVIARFKKKNGTIRYVVEDSRGLLFIFNQAALSAMK